MREQATAAAVAARAAREDRESESSRAATEAKVANTAGWLLGHDVPRGLAMSSRPGLPES